MAAPTSVRVESNSISTTVIRWTYGGANGIAVFRSTDGSSYSEVTSILDSTRVTPGTTSYNDTSLATATKYWYKLSDDGGSTFSSVVTVFTQSCAGPADNQDTNLSLPRFLGDDEIDAERLNDMQQRIENALQGIPVAQDSCLACPEDGAVVVDCSTGCNSWTVIADQDINSVSINWCNNFDGRIDFLIPPGTDVGICGFPAGFGFTGDECSDARFNGGTNGRAVSLGFNGGGTSGGITNATTTGSRPSTNQGIGRGSGGGGGGSGGAGGAGCTCVPVGGALTIKSCNANNSLNCSSTKKLKLIACGGRAPYSWSKTGSIALAVGTNGNEVTVTPPTNSNPNEAGEAYRIVYCSCSSTNTNVFVVKKFKCDDSDFQTPQCSEVAATSAMTCNNGDISSCCVAPLVCNGDGSGGTCTCGKHTNGVGACDRCSNTLPAGGKLCDVRTAGMISGGCAPCGLMDGSTVSVKDSLGVTATIIVRA